MKIINNSMREIIRHLSLYNYVHKLPVRIFSKAYVYDARNRRFRTERIDQSH